MLPPLKEEKETQPTTHVEAVALDKRLGDQPIGQTRVETITGIESRDNLMEDMNFAENLIADEMEETTTGLITDVRREEKIIVEDTRMDPGKIEENEPPLSTTPSVGESLQLEESLVKSECIIKRGKCQTHQIAARKVVTTSKKWGKVKQGYGWIYRKNVNYCCKLQSVPLGGTGVSDGANLCIPDNPAIVGIQQQHIV